MFLCVPSFSRQRSSFMAQSTDGHSTLSPASATAQNSNASDQDIVRDEQFYFRIVVFRAGNTLFKVPTYAFPADEGLFASMFLLPSGDSEPEGSSDENPICLPPEISAFDFKSLLKACLPQPAVRASPKLDVDEWMSVLKLSSMWCLDDLRAKAVSEADSGVAKLGRVERLVLAKRYSVSRWLVEAVKALAKRGTGLSAAERDKIGDDLCFGIAQLRERSWAWADSQRIGEPHKPGHRFAFDFDSAIHDIFKDELALDKEYSAPAQKH